MDEKAMDEKFELPSYSSLTVYSGRPDIQQLLEEEVELAAGPVSVDGVYDETLLRTEH